ncbi:Tumor necrosis factor receptor superfamily member 4 [Lonchura striata]|uniref:Tumor necrosis factor receptor superfamily member 4 n=1 Tax=Lonchura striata TaxID=40157 RepID=A0A218UHW6_9PASE|nr:Tumor necrosis factor receptor superfamily member 4 [Lonchura striata domestica]
MAWSLPAFCWLLAVPAPAWLGSACPERQYRFHERCCSDCAPGERMRSRCTATADTICSPCQDGYFSSQHHHGLCNSCTVCNALDKSGNSAGKSLFFPPECSRCPAGTFSRGKNENCQPWTNCSTLGKSTLRAGTGEEDAQCGTEFPENRRPFPTEFPENRASSATEFPENRASSATEFPGKRASSATEFPENRDPFPTEFPENGSRASSPREIPVVCRDPGVPTEPGWGSLSLLLLCLLLLLVSGISILLLIVQAVRKKSRNGPARSGQHKGSSCRIPIQEEQIDSNSSLIKN